MKNTLYDIAVNYTERQEHIIDPLQREAPLFRNLPCMETSQIDKNVFEVIKDVAVPTVTDYDAPLPNLYANTELNYASLAKIGGRIPLPLDKCRMMGRENLFRKQIGPILDRTGMAFDFAFMYNSLRKYCLENAADCATDIGGTGYSMVGVTWQEGENYGLFKPALSGAKIFDLYWLNGGNIGNIPDKSGKNISGYEAELVTFLGIQLPRKDRIHSLVNIDATHLPTYAQLLDFVYAFGGTDPENSVIFAHPKLINKLRAAFMQETQHKDFISYGADRTLYIDQCRLIPDANMLDGTEEQVVLS